jgi:riboflavin synthase
MFTGLVQDVGTIQSIQKSASGATLSIQTSFDTSDFELGESIAVDGCCLTVTSFTSNSFTVDCSPETMRVTALGQRTTRSKVHLERALRVGDRLGGHLVSGHVDGVGKVERVAPEGNAILITIKPPKELLRYMIAKGSIAMDGVSLTINSIDQQHFSVAIIPHTQDKTHLMGYQAGNIVNLEVDQIGKYIEKFVLPWQDTSSSPKGIDKAFLKEHGFSK